MEGLAGAGKQASDMIILPALSGNHGGGGESSSVEVLRGLVHALGESSLQAFAAAGTAPAGRHPRPLSVVVGVLAALSIGGLIYYALSGCRCFGRRNRGGAAGNLNPLKGSDV